MNGIALARTAGAKHPRGGESGLARYHSTTGGRVAITNDEIHVSIIQAIFCFTNDQCGTITDMTYAFEIEVY